MSAALHRNSWNSRQTFSVDVSFISLHHVLPYVLPLLKPDAAGAILIKPQFEAGRKTSAKTDWCSRSVSMYRYWGIF